MFSLPQPRFLSFLLVMVCCAVVCSSCGSSLSLGGHSTSRLKEVVYTPDDWPEALPAHLYQPESESPTPAVLLVHGGSWALGDDRYQMSAIARRLAKRGYLVMNVTYRMTPEWFFPDPVDDLKQALAWLRSHAGELNVDAGRIGLFGYSAGGQLVAMLGLAGDEPGVRAIVAGSTPHDMTLVADEDVVKVFLRGTYEEYPDGYRAASPLFNVTVSSPSMFLYHGTRDDVVVPEHSVKMQRELARKGIPHELHWVKGRGHVGTFLFPGKAMDHAIDFLDRELSAE